MYWGGVKLTTKLVRVTSVNVGVDGLMGLPE
jgi:hypothetical protein